MKRLDECCLAACTTSDLGSELSDVVAVSFVSRGHGPRRAFSLFFCAPSTNSELVSQLEAEIQYIIVRLISRTTKFLGQKIGGVTRHSKCDSCRPTAAFFSALTELLGQSGVFHRLLPLAEPLPAAWSTWTCGRRSQLEDGPTLGLSAGPLGLVLQGKVPRGYQLPHSSAVREPLDDTKTKGD